jgi:UrcA family protein
MKNLTYCTRLSGLAATAILGVLACSFSVVAAADAGSQSVDVIVKFAGLDISSQAGAVVLYDRIRAAAKTGCSYFYFTSDAAEARCIRDAIAGAVTKVNQLALFAVYNSRNKTPLPNALVSQSR